MIPVRAAGAHPYVIRPAARCDCSVCPLWTGNPDAVEPVCSGCNTDCSYCGCARNETGTASGAGGCGQCSIRCGSRVDIDAWMADIDGTVTFDDIDPGCGPWPDLPRFVPMLDAVATAAEVDPGLGWPAYALGLRRVFLPGTHRIAERFRAATARHRNRLAEAIAAMGWDLVLTPNFSMYGNQPRAEHLLNFRRNLMVAAELAEHGVACAPNLYWYRLEDLERIVAWIADTTPVAVAVNCQTFRTDDAYTTMLLPGLAYLAGALDDLAVPTRMVLTGLSRAARIREAVRLFGDRLTVVSQNPIQYARHGAVMTDNGRKDVHATVPDAFAVNVRHYATLLQEGGR